MLEDMKAGKLKPIKKRKNVLDWLKP